MSAGLKFCYSVMLHLIYISAAKQLIVINLIQNKSFCLHNIYVFTVYIMYKYTHIQYIFWKYLHVYIYITDKYWIFILQYDTILQYLNAWIWLADERFHYFQGNARRM